MIPRLGDIVKYSDGRGDYYPALVWRIVEQPDSEPKQSYHVLVFMHAPQQRMNVPFNSEPQPGSISPLDDSITLRRIAALESKLSPAQVERQERAQAVARQVSQPSVVKE